MTEDKNIPYLDDGEDDTGEPADEDDVLCAEFGFFTDLKDDYMKNTGKKPFTKNKDPTKHFFKWYLEKSDLKKVELIRGTILKNDYQEVWQDRMNDLIDKKNAKEHDNGESQKKENKTNFSELNLEEQLLIKQEECLNLKILLQALYIFMNTKMDIKEGVQTTPEEENAVKAVEEVLEKNEFKQKNRGK